MALGFQKQIIECRGLQKCGDITASFTSGKKEYFLNCEFCDYSFLELENFLQHIFDDHSTELNGLSNKRGDDLAPPQVVEENGDYENNLVSKNEGEKSSPQVEDDDYELSMLVEKIEEEASDTDNELRDFERVEMELDNDDIESSLDIKEETFDKELNEDSTHSFKHTENIEYIEQIFKTESVIDTEVIENGRQHYETQPPNCSKNSQMQRIKPGYDDSQTFIIELIELYRSLRALWDPKCFDYTDRMMRNLQYGRLLEKYKEQYPNATVEDVRQKIYSLRTAFRRESKRLAPFEKSSLYYYDAMSFLIEKPHESRLQSHTISANLQENLTAAGRKTPPPESQLNDKQCIILAKIYQSYPNLWNENDIAYRFSNRRRETLQSVCKEFNEQSGMNLDKNELDREISRLRKACSMEKKYKLNCKQNNIIYKPICPYAEHITFLEIDVNPYECTICGQLISGSSCFKIHMSGHDGTLPFKCHLCGHGFKLATNLTVHLRRHVQDYTYICDLCNKPCATATELRIHKRYHTGEKNIVCDICGAKFYTVSKFNTHMRRHENRPRHKCEICGKGYYTRGLYLEHMSAHGNVRDKMCDVCNKGFKNKMQLKQHKRIHDPIKKYVCKICGKRFAQFAGLSGHMKSHGTKLTSKKTAAQLDSTQNIFFADDLDKQDHV